MLLKLIIVLALTANILIMVNTTAYGSHYSKLQELDSEEYQKKIQKIREQEKKSSPLQQIKDGIQPKDVLCDKGLRLVLKWSGNNVACVEDKIAKKLEKINWGIQRSETVFPILDEKCDTVFEVTYHDNSMQNEFKIIKSIRQALQDVRLDQQYGLYDHRIDYLDIHPAIDNKPSWIVIQHMSLDENDQEYEKIFNALTEIKNIATVNSVKVLCA